MTTKLEVFNRALDLIGEQRLASLTQMRVSRYALDDAYAFSLQVCLEQGIWRHALRSVSITATSLPSLSYGFTQAFTVPADLVHTYLLGSTNVFSPPLIDALEADGLYFARATPIYCRYTSNGASYGGNLAIWPNVFAKYFIAELASEIAYQLTRSPEVVKFVQSIAAIRLAEARATDAIMGSTGILPYNALVRRELTGSTEIQEPFPFGTAVPVAREAAQ